MQFTTNFANEQQRQLRSRKCQRLSAWAATSHTLLLLTILALSGSVTLVLAKGNETEVKEAENSEQRQLLQQSGQQLSTQSSSFSPAAQPSRKVERNLMREYLSKGMWNCSRKHVIALQQLNKLIASAHREYSECKAQMASRVLTAEEQRKLAEQLTLLDELFN